MIRRYPDRYRQKRISYKTYVRLRDDMHADMALESDGGKYYIADVRPLILVARKIETAWMRQVRKDTHWLTSSKRKLAGADERMRKAIKRDMREFASRAVKVRQKWEEEKIAVRSLEGFQKEFEKARGNKPRGRNKSQITEV